MSLLSVDDARARMLKEASATTSEDVDLLAADGRTLAEDVLAKRTQPPFDVSAMDGYAVQASNVRQLPATLNLIGESAAGHGFSGSVGAGQAVRIFTGAPVPNGADAIVIQEDTVADGDQVVVREGMPEVGHIRRRGIDFTKGDQLIGKDTLLSPRDITLAAAMGHASLAVRRKPHVALIATGDELVLPGEATGPDQIVCSNPFGIAGIVARAGGTAEFLGIAKDNPEHLAGLCKQGLNADVLVTIGGASVGDHDIVAPVLESLGMSLDFWRIAMRPGKPLMFGRLNKTLVVGLPGNPVSSLICTRVFIVPLIKALLGQRFGSEQLESAVAAIPMTPNGPRQHYMRATSEIDTNGRLLVTPVPSQDSSLLSPLSRADILIVRPAGDGAVAAGESVQIMRLDF